jgi:hypothetical protein
LHNANLFQPAIKLPVLIETAKESNYAAAYKFGANGSRSGSSIFADARARAAHRMDDRARQTEQSGAMQWLIDVQRLMQAGSFSKRVREFEQSTAGQWARGVQRLMQTDSFSKQAQEFQRALEPWRQSELLPVWWTGSSARGGGEPP